MHTKPTNAPSTTNPTSEPTNLPSTANPTAEPTNLVTSQPTNLPVSPPTTSGVAYPVANVVGKSSPVTGFGCSFSTSWPQAVDMNTDPFACNIVDQVYGIEISPYHKQLSTVKNIRVYSSKHYPGRDPVTYILEGRTDSGSPWQFVAQGDFEWKSQSNPPRNGSGNKINSSYESGDPSRSFTTAVSFPVVATAYLDYRISLTTRSDPAQFKFAEIELPGEIQAAVTKYEPEDAIISASTIQTASTGDMYVDFNGSGSYVEFTNVDGGSGGSCVLSINYANGKSSPKPVDVMLNGQAVGTMTIVNGKSWADLLNEAIEATCVPGLNNVVRFTSSAGSPNIFSMTVYKSISSAPPTTQPPVTAAPVTPSPTNQVCFISLSHRAQST
jgi:hypothetical protein